MASTDYDEASWVPKRALPLKALPAAPPPDFFRRDLHMPSKPILCLDFDGVLHSYTSGWKGVDIIPDPPVPGAMQFLVGATEAFQVSIFSSRSKDRAGVQAMRKWLRYCLEEEGFSEEVELEIDFSAEKPPAMLTIDDRALTFTGRWPSIEELKAFKPWYQRPAESPSHDILVEVANERRRQVVEKGFTPTHDDQLTEYELTQSAICHAASPEAGEPIEEAWPFDTPFNMPGSVREGLIQACALLVAEIERLDRLDARTTEQRG